MSMPKIAVIIITVLNVVFAGSVACLWVGAAQPAIAQQKVASGEPDSRQIERGRYLVKISGCNDCHTAGYAMTGGNIPESQWLMGDKLGWRGPWGTTYPANLRSAYKLTYARPVGAARESTSDAPADALVAAA